MDKPFSFCSLSLNAPVAFFLPFPQLRPIVLENLTSTHSHSSTDGIEWVFTWGCVGVKVCLCIHVCILSPVTMTVRMLACRRSCSTPGVSVLSLFCMMIIPRNSMFVSIWSLVQRNIQYVHISTWMSRPKNFKYHMVLDARKLLIYTK